eukprot:9264656-Pyramimonas_sp.AAC.1
MELEKPVWLQVPQRAGGEVSRARMPKEGKGDHEIIGQLVLIIALLALTDSRAIAELTATYALDYVEGG